MDYLQRLNLFAPGNFPENQVFKLQSQTKVAGTLPRNAVCLLLASLLTLPMFFITVNSLNVHQLWEGKKTAKCPNNFDWDCSWVIFWSLSWYKELKHTKTLFTGHALGSLLIQMQNISFRSSGMCRKQNFEIVVGVHETRFFWGIFRSMCYMCVFFLPFTLGLLDWIMLTLVWFERSLHPAQVSWQSCS